LQDVEARERTKGVATTRTGTATMRIAQAA